MAAGGGMAPHEGRVLEAVAYAVREANSSGGLRGRPLELLFEDSESELNTAHAATRRLIDRDVTVIFTSCDPYFSRPVREAAHGAGTLVIVPCGPEPLPTLAAGRDRVFSAGTSAQAYGRALAEYAVDAGIFSAATLVEADRAEAVQMCDSFDRRFAELGGSRGFTLRFDRFWIAAQPVVGAQATARALERAAEHPAVVLCAAVGGRGIRMFELLRSAGIGTEVLAPAALAGVAGQRGIFGLEPLTVITEASTFGDDPSAQVNAYFASIITGDLRREPESAGRDVDPRGLAQVVDLRREILLGRLDGRPLASHQLLRRLQDPEYVDVHVSQYDQPAPDRRPAPERGGDRVGSVGHHRRAAGCRGGHRRGVPAGGQRANRHPPGVGRSDARAASPGAAGGRARPCRGSGRGHSPG